MSTDLSRATGIRVDLDVDRLREELAEHVAKRVAEHLAGLFPSEAAEFWAALCDQAYQEQRRVAAMLDLTCPHQVQCPHRAHVLAGVQFGGEPRDRTGPG